MEVISLLSDLIMETAHRKELYRDVGSIYGPKLLSLLVSMSAESTEFLVCYFENSVEHLFMVDQGVESVRHSRTCQKMSVACKTICGESQENLHRESFLLSSPTVARPVSASSFGTVQLCRKKRMR